MSYVSRGFQFVITTTSSSFSQTPSSVPKPTKEGGDINPLPNKKRKPISKADFIEKMQREHGVKLVHVNELSKNGRRQSKCALCNKVRENKGDNWKGHANKCATVPHMRERARMSSFVGAGGEDHRMKLVDTYMLAFFTYKERLPFTLPERLKKVPPPPLPPFTLSLLLSGKSP